MDPWIQVFRRPWMSLLGKGPGLAWAQRARHNFLTLQDLPGLGLQVLLETTVLAWDCKTCLGLQVLAWDYRSGLGLQVLPGTTSLAWNYKSCLRLEVLLGTTPQDSRPTGRQAPNIEQSARQKSD